MFAVLAPPISSVVIWGIFRRRGASTTSLTTLTVDFPLGQLKDKQSDGSRNFVLSPSG